MRIAILAAMDKELALLKEQVIDCREESHGHDIWYVGKIGPHEVVISKCGIGKVNSALKTYRIICDWQPELVINSGVAGGVDSCAPVGTILIADGAGYHDVWCGPGTLPGQADGSPAVFKPYPRGLSIAGELQSEDRNIQLGLIASGDMFITKPEEIDKIKHIYSEAIACDMESASIAQACSEAGIPFMVVRVISDMPGNGNNIEEYQNFWTDAPVKTFNIIEMLLSRL